MKIVPIDETQDFLKELNMFPEQIEHALDVIAECAKLDFESTADDWKRKPKFTITKSPGVREVYTEDVNYARINYGTRGPYPIEARNGRAMLIYGKNPKTNAAYGIKNDKVKEGEIFFAKKVKHPGIAPRAFQEFMWFHYANFYDVGMAVYIMGRILDGENVQPHTTGFLQEYPIKNS